MRRILALMAPAIFGVSVSQINLLLDTVLASFLETGSVSWLYYSDRLNELPLGVFGIAIATVVLPSLSRKHASASTEAFSHTLDWALKMVLLVGAPAAVALAVLAEPLLGALFKYGEFRLLDVQMAALSLQAYSGGLLAFMLIKVLATGYFSRQDTRTPVRIGVIAMVANMVLNLLLIWHLRHAGLALATAASAWVNTFLLYRGLARDGVYRPGHGWGLFMLRLVAATALMALVTGWWAHQTTLWYSAPALERAAALGLLVLTGAGCYAGALLVFGMRPRHLRRA